MTSTHDYFFSAQRPTLFASRSMFYKRTFPKGRIRKRKRAERKFHLKAFKPGREGHMAAAAGSPLRNLCDELTCPICLECFKDPVTITTCGHNFCRTCLSCYCRGPESEGGGGTTSCPQCRKTFDHGQNIIPNRLLANVVQIAEKFRRAEQTTSGPKVNLCEKYHRPVRVSCQHQTVLRCAICGTTKPQNSNRATPTTQRANGENKVNNENLARLDQDVAFLLLSKTPGPAQARFCKPDPGKRRWGRIKGGGGKRSSIRMLSETTLSSRFPIIDPKPAGCSLLLAGEAFKTRFCR